MIEYINKQDTIAKIQQIYCTQCDNHNGAMCRACEHMDDMDIIEDTSTADVQPFRYGEWITKAVIPLEKPEYLKGLNIVRGRCSVCLIFSSEVSNQTKITLPYCPQCGAIMR